MHPFALSAVLLAALTHATWNVAAKKAAGSRHFVWLYSAGSVVLYTPISAWILIHQQLQLEWIHWAALLLTGILHTGYSVLLQAGYRTSDLSLVYPIARGTGPLLSFLAATLLFQEAASALSVLGVIFVVGGILLVSGLMQQPHKAPRAGIAFGIMTGVFIAAYTINDAWAVKVLLISPILVDFSGNVFRLIVLAPLALRDPAGIVREMRLFKAPVLIVSVLGPLGYILVLFAMQLAPIGHVAPMRELATLIGTYFGARLLSEQGAPQRLVGAGLIVTGVLVLAFTG